MISQAVNHEVALSPARIMETGLGFWSSKVLLTAVKLDIFSLLSNGSKTAEEIRTILQLQRRGLYDFLDALVALKFLNRKGLRETAIYSNTRETATFLDKKKSSYVGGMLVMANDRLYPFWNNLEEGLKTGRPQNEVKHGQDLFDELYKDQERLETFVEAMASVQSQNFIAFAQQFDFSGYNTHCDIGGAGGHLSAQIVTHNPHMRSTSFDLPEVLSIARRNLDAMDVSSNVEVVSGNFFADPFPRADVITMGNILHDWNLEKKKLLIQKAFDALHAGGVFVVIENAIDDERKENAFGLMMSLNMLIETEGGFDFTPAEFTDWALEAGFSSTGVMHLAGPSSALIAYK